MAVANEMLSLTASIQDDPFSILHVPKSGTTSVVAQLDSEDEDDAEDDREESFPLVENPSTNICVSLPTLDVDFV